MATFFGGEELVEIKRFSNVFTPSDQQKFDIYTVPSGRYALIKKYSMVVDGLPSGGYYMVIEHNIQALGVSSPFTVNQAASSAFPKRYKEAIASADTTAQLSLQDQLANQRSFDRASFTVGTNNDPTATAKDVYLEAGERIRFESFSNTNAETAYFLIVHEFKVP